MNPNLDKLYKAYPVLNLIFEPLALSIETQLSYKHLNETDCLPSMGDICREFPFVIEGALSIQKCNDDGKSIHLYTLHVGDICHEGLRCLLNTQLNHIKATALCKTEICMVPLPLIEKHLLANPIFLKYLYEDLSEKFSYLIHNKDSLLNESLETRLIKLLLSYNSTILYTTHQKLATQLDSAREVISKKLKELEDNGHLTMTRGKIKLNQSIHTLI